MRDHAPAVLRRVVHRPLPAPPDLLRQGPLREGAFTSPLHNRYVAAWLGYALGWSFLVCFATGLVSHWLQQPPGWFALPARPVWLYRATQGTHVATGLACIPLLLGKLWTVYPRFWEWPPLRSVAHAAERLSLLGLVGGSVLQLLTGLANIYQWYFFRFFFTPTHYFTSFVVMGCLLVHVGSKVTLARDALRHPERYDPPPAPRRASTALSRPALPPLPPPPRRVEPADPTPGEYDRRRVVASRPAPVWFARSVPMAGRAPAGPPAAPAQVRGPVPAVPEGPAAPEGPAGPDRSRVGQPLVPGLPVQDLPPGLSRRWLLATVGAAAAAVTVTTAGQAVPGLRAVSVLAPRRIGSGGSRLPVNKSARAAGVVAAAGRPDFTLTVTGRLPAPVVLDLAALAGLARSSADLPLTCVEGWSVGARWTGIPVADLLARAGAPRGAAVRVESLEAGGLYRSSVLSPAQVRARTTLLATHLDGQPLTLDHGYPLRLIAANRPGVLQTKWVSQVVVL